MLLARVDTSWPPILTFLVLGGAIAAAVGTFVIFRQLRAAARGDSHRE